MAGTIFLVTVPETIIRSAWRGLGRMTSMPKRARSQRLAAVAIISMAQQARPKSSGQMLLLAAPVVDLVERRDEDGALELFGHDDGARIRAPASALFDVAGISRLELRSWLVCPLIC